MKNIGVKRFSTIAALLLILSYATTYARMTINDFRPFAPIHLTTDLLKHTERVFIGGYPSTLRLEELHTVVEPWQVAEIRSEHPYFGWVLGEDMSNTVQTAYRILVATSATLLEEGKADMWDSGCVQSANSSTVKYEGNPLQPATTYYWKVKTWNNHGMDSEYSQAKGFRTADTLDNGFSFYPLEKTDEAPMSFTRLTDGSFFADFGEDAFGQLTIKVSTKNDNDTLTIHLGEQVRDGHVNRKPEGSQRYAMYRLPLMRGTHTYKVKFRKDRRNTTPKQNESGVDPVLMPSYIGEVFPFRYCEIEGVTERLETHDVVRHRVNIPFDERASHFESSDTVLNKVWQLCKHTIKATSFCGIYVDGDRERIPYEADAIINQLSHYAVDREFSMARRSVNHLIYNPTWPTEWILQSVIMAWNDYLYTGDKRLLRSVYYDLKSKTLIALRDENGLISTRTGKVTKDVLVSIHFNGKGIRDIVDWPQTGAEGIEKEAAGETDGFVFTEYNAVVNAYHYEALKLMALIADAIGNVDDAAMYRSEAAKTRKAFNELLYDADAGIYKDGVTTNHHSLHSNMFALGFGLLTDGDNNIQRKGNRVAKVVEFMKSRKMACSVYGAQFLLDALYDNEESDYALALLSSTGLRSWYNMCRIGSTITTEAWDNVYKPNQDWNHPWGAAPANIIVRKLMGIEPLEPGFERIRIKPQPSTLRKASLTVLTIKGDVSVAFDNEPNKSFVLDVAIPANTTAEVYMPYIGNRVLLDGARHIAKAEGKWLKLVVGSGKHRLQVGEL